jgi:hypothetical protein
MTVRSRCQVKYVIEGVDLDKAFRLTPEWIREHPEQIMDQLVHYVPDEVRESLGLTLDWISDHPRAALQFLRTYQPADTTMLKRTELATSQITSTETITVELIETDETPAVVIVRWPAKPSVFHPRRFPDDAAVIARMFAEAHTALAGIKARRRL